MPTHYTKLSRPQKSAVYDTYWRFLVKRNEVFVNRLNESNGPWTSDRIIASHRFTNVFRASDRVSQYLISLQYEPECDAVDVFFKTILFKFFNKIETYQWLKKEVGEVSRKSFSFSLYDKLLTERMARGEKVYSAAYIMPSAGNVFGHKFKHTNHLALLSKMLDDGLDKIVADCTSLESVYNLLLSYPSLGSFLAFQYTIDLNYSTLVNFSEMDFVVAGPGAKNGINKCFSSLGDFTYEDVIKMITEDQEHECERLGLNRPTLGGRRLQLIDCQNVFCEVDKYLRVTNPELNTDSGKSRIKQKFSAPKAPITFFFPPKWEINSQFEILCQSTASASIFS